MSRAMSDNTSTTAPVNRFLVAASGLLSLAAVLVVLLGCGFFAQGACVHGSNLYFCQEDSEDQCSEFWCDDWEYCAYFAGETCEDVGFDGVLLEEFEEPREPEWSIGSPSGGGGGGGGSGKCTSTYNGPQGDPQVSTQCMSVWNYRCQAKNNEAADKNCKVYDQLEATVSCPYCP